MKNVADFLRENAEFFPHKPALVSAGTGDRWNSITYQALNQQVDGYANGFAKRGVKRGDRVLFLVKPGFDFYATLFGLFRLGAVPVLVDPGMGLRNVLACIEQIRPKALVAIPLVQIVRLLRPKAFKSVEINVTAGMRLFWGGLTLKQCLEDGSEPFVPEEPFTGEEEGFIAFTSGSTGTPKGVSFLHRMFGHQAKMLGEQYGMGPNDSTLECFAAFVIYDLVLGMTTVLADMNMSKPATANPAKIAAALQTHKVTTAFASPVVWANLIRHGKDKDIQFPHLKRVLTAGAPIPAWMHEGIAPMLQDGVELFTPYGATESLPVASLGSREVLEDTWKQTQEGHGTCVGRVFDGVTVEVVQISEDPMPVWSDDFRVAPGEIGEIVVDAPIVSPEYKDNPAANAVSKIQRDGRTLHRMGDLGYFDTQGRLWFCGRKSHAVWTENGMVPCVPVEGMINGDTRVARVALVGVGAKGRQVPVLCVELEDGVAFTPVIEAELVALTEDSKWSGVIARCLHHPGFPVDARHNSKIKREVLKGWAQERCGDLIGVLK